MGNRHKGEVSIEIDGEVYTMALTVDAMVALEDQFSTTQKFVTFQEVLAQADRGSVKAIRALLWAALQLHHPGIEMKDISPLVHAAGGLNVMTEKFTKLARESFADPNDLEALGVKAGANPPQAQADKTNRGTGARSSSRPAVSA